MFGAVAMALFVFAALVLGAVQFLLCVAVPRMRPYALSAAAWWAVFGPCLLGMALAGGLGLVLASESGRFRAGPNGFLQPSHAVGWAFAVAALCLSALIASGVAWLHQVITRRFTFALFRLYATAVVAGIGSVFGWCLAFWFLSHPFPYVWVFALWGVTTPAIIFGAAAHRHARQLRGKPPTRFAWVTAEEFEGTVPQGTER